MLDNDSKKSIDDQLSYVEFKNTKETYNNDTNGPISVPRAVAC